MLEQVTPQRIIDFWVNAGPDKWWKKDEQFDAEIARCFGATHLQASLGFHDEWCEQPGSALALILGA